RLRRSDFRVATLRRRRREFRWGGAVAAAHRLAPDGSGELSASAADEPSANAADAARCAHNELCRAAAAGAVRLDEDGTHRVGSFLSPPPFGGGAARPAPR